MSKEIGSLYSRIRCVVLDVEGTTTPIDFVYSVLFPYVRRNLVAFLSAKGRDDAVLSDIAALRGERLQDEPEAPSCTDAESPVPYLLWLMDRDRKSPALKSLQGKIWEYGYQQGELIGQLFSDVPDALRRWRAADVQVAIYSSGSVLAQKLLFGHSEYGDLTPLIQLHCDTGVGPKTAPVSYQRIAERLGRDCAEVLFVSDVLLELEAAQSVGMMVLLAERPGNRPVSDSSMRRIQDFTGLVPG